MVSHVPSWLLNTMRVSDRIHGDTTFSVNAPNAFLTAVQRDTSGFHFEVSSIKTYDVDNVNKDGSPVWSRPPSRLHCDFKLYLNFFTLEEENELICRFVQGVDSSDWCS